MSPDAHDEPDKKRAKTEASVVAHVASPDGRWAHTATLISGSRLIVYGGESDTCETLGNLFVFDLFSQNWREPVNCESKPRAWHTTT